MIGAAPHPKGKEYYPFHIMKEKPDALERLDIQFRWGNYGIRVLRFHLTIFAPGKAVGFHKHSNFEFHFIPKGKGRVILFDQEYDLHEGMFYLTGPGVIHYQEADAEEAMEELCLHIDIIKLEEADAPGPGSEVWDSGWEIREAGDCIDRLKRLPVRPEADQFNAMQCFLTSYQAWKENRLGLFTTIRQSIIQILLKSAQVYVEDPTHTSIPPRDMNAYRYRLATQYIQDNYSRQITLEDVADRIHISARQLQRIFHDHHSGATFSDYLETVRLNQVCFQLKNSNKTIEEIAAGSGFSSSNYLYYVFKKRYGITPNRYKKER